MTSRPYILAETTWKTVGETPYDVAILPWGATEPHNYHLPYATDNFESQAVAAEAARVAWEAGAKVVVLPGVPFGVQTGMIDLPFSLNMNPSTQAAVLSDVAHALEVQGLRKLLIVNGHGGNDFRAIIRELQPELELFLCVLNWYHCADPKAFFTAPGDHGDEIETSVMMHLYPELVRPLEEAGPGEERRFRLTGLREGWVWAPRQWTRISDDTGVGDPAASTAEKGEAFFRAVTERIGAFLVELAAADPDDLYES